MRLPRPFLCVALITLLLPLGCSSGSPFGDVHGEVLLDGQPLKEGVIRFIPADGKSSTAAALIADGKFNERVPTGTHRVEIDSNQLPKGFDPSKAKLGTVEANVSTVNIVPARYNVRTELTLTVESGKNEKRFDLKSK